MDRWKKAKASHLIGIAVFVIIVGIIDIYYPGFGATVRALSSMDATRTPAVICAEPAIASMGSPSPWPVLRRCATTTAAPIISLPTMRPGWRTQAA
jgi:hypothetical protein